MFKLYKKFRPIDWFFVVLIIGFTILQVYCTMCLVDYVKGIIQEIMYVNYKNNPSDLGEIYQLIVKAFNGSWPGWEKVKDLLANTPNSSFDSSMIDQIIEASTDKIWWNGGMMILVATGSTLCQVITAILASAVTANFATELRQELNDKVSSFSLGEINKFSTASLITRTTNDIEQVQMTNLMMMRMVFAAPVTAIWALCKIQVSSSQLTVLTSIVLVVLVICLITIILFAMPTFKKMQSFVDRINGLTQENLTGIRVVRAYNGEKYQETKFDKANKILTRAQILTGQLTALIMPLMMIALNGLTLGIYWLGAKLLNQGEITYPAIASFSMLASQIIMAFMMLIMMFVMWPRASVCAKRILDVLNTKPSIVDPLNPKKPITKGEIEFDNVSFRYPGAENDVVSNLNFKINKGQTLAFIGATGSGKSTIVNLMTRLYDATNGEVKVDGVNVKDLTQRDLRSLIGYVPQKGNLFTGTIKDNISFGKPNLSLQECQEAAKIACADEFISRMDEGYDFNIAQGGTNVSGGQRQRLCIARAIAIKPEILIFDDSFSALDYKTDKQLRENLKKSQKDATKVIVATRIGTIMDADKIVVLADGKIVGYGTHQELLHNCKAYLDIALSQLSKEELGL